MHSEKKVTLFLNVSALVLLQARTAWAGEKPTRICIKQTAQELQHGAPCQLNVFAQHPENCGHIQHRCLLTPYKARFD